jgi:tetratricopeptide (TPR) repeat protein
MMIVRGISILTSVLFLVVASFAPALAQAGAQTPPKLSEIPAAGPENAIQPQSNLARPPDLPRSPANLPRPPVNLPKLLDDLKESKDSASAKVLMLRIERIWLRSGSDTADLMMSRVRTALQKKDAALAVELTDRILAIKPDWAEAWNKRATAFFLLGDTARAVSDLAETLKREPRHYQALAGLGAIFNQNGDKKNALAAFRKALEINPYFEDILKSVERLAPDVDGQSL